MPPDMERSPIDWTLLNPQPVTIRNGANSINVEGPSLIIPISVPDGYMLAYPGRRDDGPAASPTPLNGFDQYLRNGGFSCLLPHPGLWSVYYNGTDGLKAVRLTFDSIQDAAAFDCGDGSYTVVRHTLYVSTGASQDVMAANARAVYRCFQNDSDSVFYLRWDGSAAAANIGVRLNANGGSYEMSKKQGNMYYGLVKAFCASSSKNLIVTECGPNIPGS